MAQFLFPPNAHQSSRIIRGLVHQIGFIWMPWGCLAPSRQPAIQVPRAFQQRQRTQLAKFLRALPVIKCCLW